eukprot:670806-Amphidinium_carterae.1
MPSIWQSSIHVCFVGCVADDTLSMSCSVTLFSCMQSQDEQAIPKSRCMKQGQTQTRRHRTPLKVQEGQNPGITKRWN